MSDFANLTAKLNLNIQNFSNNMRKASGMMNQFAANSSGAINLSDKLEKNTRAWGLNIKSVSQVVSGILISKAFYSSLQSIRQASAAVWDFSKQLEYAKIAYSNLFGSTEVASEFINVLKDFAARTPFTFQESEAAAKRLLAYGVQYKNVMYVMQGVLSASAMQGNPEVIERVSRALGQIYTKGRLMNEEMRQLAESGIPAYDILRKKLGLTQKQLQNLGREGIPASKAINALVDGMQERFGSVITASMYTIQGIMSNLKDNTVMLTSAMFDPFTQRIKAAMYSLGNLIAKLRVLQETKGTGAVMESLFPKSMQNDIRLFVSNVQAVFGMFKVNLATIKNIAGYAAYGIVTALNLLLPPLTALLSLFAAMQYVVTSNAIVMKILTGILVGAAAAWALFRVQVLATFIVGKIVGVINAISASLLFLSKVLVSNPILTVMILLAAGLIGVSIASDRANSSLTKLFSKFASLNGVDPNKILKPVTKDRAANLDKFNESLDNTGDSIDGVAKKAKAAKSALLSFDEVYTIGKDGSGADTANTEEPGVDLNIPGLGGDALIPEIPSFDDFGNKFTDKLFGALKGKLINAGIGMGLGAILGAIIGGIIGGPAGAILGAKIGAFAGAIIGWFWDDIKKFFLESKEGGATLFGAGIGSVIGFVLGGPAGALIGAAVGALAGWVVSHFWENIKKYFTDPGTAGAYMGAGIGAAIGFVMGGPAGAAIGAAVGALVGWIGGKVKENWPLIKEKFSDGWADVTTTVDAFRTNFDTKFNGIVEIVKTKATDIKDKISNAFSEANTNMLTTLGGMATSASEKWSGIKNAIFVHLTPIADTIKTKFSTASTDFKDSLNSMLGDAGTILKNIYDKFTGWISDMWTSIFEPLFGWIKNALDALKELDMGSTSNSSRSSTTKTTTPAKKKAATGAIITKEEIFRLGEGDKKEAVVPLDNLGAMQPFSSAVAAQMMQIMLPLFASMNGGNSGSSPITVNAGVLVADDYGIKELERRLAIARAQESTRR